MVQFKLDLLFGGQRVEGAGFQTRKGAISRGENGQVVGNIKLVFDLVNDLGASEDADEDAESAGLVEDLGTLGHFGGSLNRAYCLSWLNRGLNRWFGWRLGWGLSHVARRVLSRRLSGSFSEMAEEKE
ncbi:hypothetical protein PanWU01x14_070370 [Parasponia andersonii]|uniref:Uncharacterized protein n=1 Tax=Parasponia andersonii TaxID=3476 RepID=A0A2P5DF06_PARAD|nr:hypothetical protein PanWU01x14_070370 [Parasponia andersonii]